MLKAALLRDDAARIGMLVFFAGMAVTAGLTMLTLSLNTDAPRIVTKVEYRVPADLVCWPKADDPRRALDFLRAAPGGIR